MFEELVKKAKLGDAESVEKIVLRLQPLLVSSIRKYFNIPEEYEDSMQDGNLLIIECIGSYDEGRGAYFLAYIKSKLKYLYLNKNKEKKCISLNEKLKDERLELIDTLKSEDMSTLDRIILSQGNEKLYAAYEKLSKREKEVIDLYYIKGKNMKDIAVELNVSYRTVINTKTNGINRLRKILNNNQNKKIL